MSYPVLIYRPLTSWPGKRTQWPKASPFGAKTTWVSTLDLIGREMYMLDVEQGVLQVDNPSERNFRVDGSLRADAKLASGAVILSVEPGKRSKIKAPGKLSFPCDTFMAVSYDSMESWQVNVRAIALGLEALRKVERYGIANTGQQYTGWAQLPPGGTPLDEGMTVEAAARYVAQAAERPDAWSRVLAEPDLMAHLYRTAARKVHPDVGGSTAAFRRLQEAKNLLDKGTP